MQKKKDGLHSGHDPASVKLDLCINDGHGTL